MNQQDQIEAEQRRQSAAFKMSTARRRHRREKGAGPFRAWAARTYNAFACAGKLAAIVSRKNRP